MINIFKFQESVGAEDVDNDTCVYYNRTTKKIISSIYEGIPENLLLNFLGWLVRKYN